MGTYSFSDVALADLNEICTSLSKCASLSKIDSDVAIHFSEKVRDKCRQYQARVRIRIRITVGGQPLTAMHQGSLSASGDQP
jgi:hypothetical protein